MYSFDSHVPLGFVECQGHLIFDIIQNSTNPIHFGHIVDGQNS